MWVYLLSFQVYNQGLRNLDLKFVMVELCLPVLVVLGLLLALPYIVAKSLLPLFGSYKFTVTMYLNILSILGFSVCKPTFCFGTIKILWYHILRARDVKLSWHWWRLNGWHWWWSNDLALQILWHHGSDVMQVFLYLFFTLLVLFVGFGFEVQNLLLRRIYPFLLSICLLVSFCIFQARQFRRLYEHIKNDKWVTVVTKFFS